MPQAYVRIESKRTSARLCAKRGAEMAPQLLEITRFQRTLDKVTNGCLDVLLFVPLGQHLIVGEAAQD